MTENRVPLTVEVYPKRFWVSGGSISFIYKSRFSLYQNQYFGYEWWFARYDDVISIGFSANLWNKESFRYDGHRFGSVTILGIRVGYGTTYDCSSLEDFEDRPR